MSAELELLLRRYAEEEDRATAAVTAGEAAARARHTAALDASERTDPMRSGRLGVRREHPPAERTLTLLGVGGW